MRSSLWIIQSPWSGTIDGSCQLIWLILFTTLPGEKTWFNYSLHKIEKEGKNMVNTKGVSVINPGEKPASC
jgi:hypothetical protein